MNVWIGPGNVREELAEEVADLSEVPKPIELPSAHPKPLAWLVRSRNASLQWLYTITIKRINFHDTREESEDVDLQKSNILDDWAQLVLGNFLGSQTWLRAWTCSLLLQMRQPDWGWVWVRMWKNILKLLQAADLTSNAERGIIYVDENWQNSRSERERVYHTWRFAKEQQVLLKTSRELLLACHLKVDANIRNKTFRWIPKISSLSWVVLWYWRNK